MQQCCYHLQRTAETALGLELLEHTHMKNAGSVDLRLRVFYVRPDEVFASWDANKIPLARGNRTGIIHEVLFSVSTRKISRRGSGSPNSKVRRICPVLRGCLVEF